MKAVDYDHNTDCHPFWHIRRSPFAGEFNSAVVEVEIKSITSSSMKSLKTDDYRPTIGIGDFEVKVPCIVNTAKIAGGAEIVLKWEKGKRDDKEPRLKRSRNSFQVESEHLYPTGVFVKTPKRVKQWGVNL